MTIEQRLDLKREDRRHEGTLARLGGRGKFTGCRECMSPDGMRSAGRETLAQFPQEAMERLAWYKEPHNNFVLYYSCPRCNPDGCAPDDWMQFSIEDVLDWLDDDPMTLDYSTMPHWHDSMQPDYAALAREPVAATAGQDLRESAGLEG